MSSQIKRSTRKYRAKRLMIKNRIKHALLILAVVAGAWALIGCSKKVARPFLLYFAESRENHQIERDIADLRSENDSLRSKVRYLKTPQGAQTEARTLGYVHKGEISLVVVPKDNE